MQPLTPKPTLSYTLEGREVPVTPYETGFSMIGGGMVFFIIAVILFFVISTFYALIDLLRSEFKNNTNKIVWLIALIFVPFAPILYLFIAPKQKK